MADAYDSPTSDGEQGSTLGSTISTQVAPSQESSQPVESLKRTRTLTEGSEDPRSLIEPAPSQRALQFLGRVEYARLLGVQLEAVQDKDHNQLHRWLVAKNKSAEIKRVQVLAVDHGQAHWPRLIDYDTHDSMPFTKFKAFPPREPESFFELRNPNGSSWVGGLVSPDRVFQYVPHFKTDTEVVIKRGFTSFFPNDDI